MFLQRLLQVLSVFLVQYIIKSHFYQTTRELVLVVLTMSDTIWEVNKSSPDVAGTRGPLAAYHTITTLHLDSVRMI